MGTTKPAEVGVLDAAAAPGCSHLAPEVASDSELPQCAGCRPGARGYRRTGEPAASLGRLDRNWRRKRRPEVGTVGEAVAAQGSEWPRQQVERVDVDGKGEQTRLSAHPPFACPLAVRFEAMAGSCWRTGRSVTGLPELRFVGGVAVGLAGARCFCVVGCSFFLASLAAGLRTSNEGIRSGSRTNTKGCEKSESPRRGLCRGVWERIADEDGRRG